MARGKKTGGRTKGALNKLSTDLKQEITDFLNDNFDEVKKEWQGLEGKEKLNFYKDLLKYSVPQMQSTSLETDLSKLTDEQLEYILNNLINKIDHE